MYSTQRYNILVLFSRELLLIDLWRDGSGKVMDVESAELVKMKMAKWRVKTML